MSYTKSSRKHKGVDSIVVCELSLQTGFSQNKFANMFDVPLATLMDWKQE